MESVGLEVGLKEDQRESRSLEAHCRREVAGSDPRGKVSHLGEQEETL